jgi:hypothetical protein
MKAQQQDSDWLQDEALGYLGDHDLSPAAEEVLAGKLFTHGKQPHPRLIVVDQTGCCGGVHFQAQQADALALACVMQRHVASLLFWLTRSQRRHSRHSNRRVQGQLSWQHQFAWLYCAQSHHIAAAGMRLQMDRALGGIQSTLWEGGIDIVRAEPVKASRFYQLLTTEGQAAELEDEALDAEQQDTTNRQHEALEV